MNKKLQFFFQHFLLRYSLQHFCFSRFIIYIPWTLLLYLFISDWYLYLSKHTCVYVYVSHTHVYKCSCWICMHGCIYTQHLPPTSPRPVLCLKFVIYIKILNVWMIKTSFFSAKEEFIGICDWEGRPLSLHPDLFLIVYSYLKSSFKTLFTSQFSS